MSRSLVLPRPGHLREPADDVPADDAPVTAPSTAVEPASVLPARTRPQSPATAEVAAGTAAETAADAPVPAEQVRARRLPRPPGRRGHLWLAALVAGALIAGVPGFFGGGATDVAATAADYGLGMSTDLGYNGGLDDAAARQSITEAEAQARLGELAASRAAREPKTFLPTQGRLTTCFCMRWGSMHWGIDLAAPLGTPIYAATDGVVLRAGPASGYGNAVYIQDPDGNVQIYGHMRYYDVRAGDVVHAGDQIAKVGNQGQSTGPHLHFELHRGGMTGKPFDPQEWLAERGISVG